MRRHQTRWHPAFPEITSLRSRATRSSLSIRQPMNSRLPRRTTDFLWRLNFDPGASVCSLCHCFFIFSINIYGGCCGAWNFRCCKLCIHETPLCACLTNQCLVQMYLLQIEVNYRKTVLISCFRYVYACSHHQLVTLQLLYSQFLQTINLIVINWTNSSHFYVDAHDCDTVLYWILDCVLSYLIMWYFTM